MQIAKAGKILGHQISGIYLAPEATIVPRSGVGG